ncbi:MAG: 50S ribosomal protein L23 [Clostridiales bacterium]|jgi:ribosomal protein L23|nr:50S ribosomal protein L23 [Clostridiales bacterium]MBF0988986.1 50S ribosomal protein L23 [Clostridiales bacterium]
MLPEDIIIKPIITEKSNVEMQAGKYTFEVNKKATKVDVKRAVEKLFNVKVLKVNTINVSGKEKRVGRNIGKTADWKKAIVSIDVNPGAEQSYLTKGGKVTKVTKKYNDSIAEVTGV